MRTRNLLLSGTLAIFVFAACEADREALDVDGEPADLAPAEEIEAAPQTPMEIIEEGDTFPRPVDDTLRADDTEPGS